MTDTPFFASLADQLNRGASRAALGILGFRNDALREHLRDLFQRVPGKDHSFLADVVFEATFGWRPAKYNFGDLSGQLLHPKLIDALSNPPESLPQDYVFREEQYPYLHQLEAWQSLISETPPRSVLVTSGTGSGKTECFLIPILNDLANEVEKKAGPLVGVRALFLYPLNALIKSQRDRLTAWSEPFGGQIRYCLYNGDTPNEARRSEWKSEVFDRKTLRATPPPILVTNATMLEYMLVRNEDRSILDQSQGKLRWIVIDEAHSYIGSQAAELTLLLRRVLHAFGCQSEDVHFVATSATISGTGQEAQSQLQEFLADIAGVGLDRVTVVEGSRLLPELPNISAKKSAALNFEVLRQCPSEKRFAMLAAEPIMLELRTSLARQALPLSSVATTLFGDKSKKTILRTLELLDLCTRTYDAKKEAFLPLRGHFFQRTLNGLWACANPACTGRTGTTLDNPAWPFGKVFLERHIYCDACRFPVFELVQCGECGAEHLSVLESTQQGNDRLNPHVFAQDEDEFQQELEPLEEEDSQEEENLNEALGPGLPRLLVAPPNGNQVTLLPDGQLDWNHLDEGAGVHLLGPGEDGNIRCPSCNGSNLRGQLFKPIRLSAPFLLQTAIPILLRHIQPKQTKEPLPYDGRRILSFTDSRQGTARIAVKLQIETERDYVRSLLYHAAADRSRTASSQDTGKIREEIAALENLKNPVLEEILEQKRRDLANAESPPVGRLTWQDAQNLLLSDEGFKRWLLPPLREQSFGMNDRQLADLCLWREFFLRPRRQWSLESFGLLRLSYPGIERIDRVPAAAAQFKISLDDWRNLAQVAMDFVVRLNKSVAIPDDTLRWIGYPGRPTLALAPGQDKSFYNQRTWPSAQSVAQRRSRLIRLLAYAVKKDLEQKEDQELLEELLIALWKDVHGLLSRTELGYRLDMSQQVEIVQVRDAWLCPVTRRVLPVTFMGLTPYLPENPAKDLVECQKVKMPVLPDPFWLNNSPKEIEEWLESNDQVLYLRAHGVWINVNDRIARFARYFRSAEHSAQLTGSTLAQREADFKTGKINLLSCSTTMEMGVDIGGLSVVAMHNAPPNPANFLQRAGRAGRRGESVALSFTLCKSTPHGEAVFHNPLWPFTTLLAPPKVSLHSPPIIQRHVNALALSTFLTHHASDNFRRLTTGWFFEPTESGESTPWEKFRAWCETDALNDENLARGVEILLRRSIMEGHGLISRLGVSSSMISQCSQGWLNEVKALKENLAIVKTSDGNGAAEKAVDFQLQRLRKEYLLSELTTRGFLPGYGFPGEVVPLITTTAEEFSRKSRQRTTEPREDNRKMRIGYPARDLAIAIRDYSPGTDTVLDGRVYRSGGVTLNWHIPVDQEGPPELQFFRWVFRCKRCGAIGTRPTKPFSCPQCGEQNSKEIQIFEYLQPSGFAVDIRWSSHNDINIPQYIPVRDPLVSMEGAEWVALPAQALGRYRVHPQAVIIHRSDGLHDNGYALCLRCGRADSMTSNDELPSIFIDKEGNPKPHKRLRGGKNNDKEFECPGGTEPWAIKANLRLGVTRRTEVFELQLRDNTGKPIDRVTAYTTGVILRRALAEKLGVEEREIGVSISSTRDISGHQTFSIYLFDTAQGGAGYVSQAVQYLPMLFYKGKEILQCSRNCDIACQGCLLSYDTQHHIQDLDRNKALAMITDQFLQALQLPVTMQVFGPRTLLEMEPLALALQRERQRIDLREVRIFLGGNVKEWEPLAWRLRQELLVIHEAGATIRLIVPENILETLESSQRDELAALAALINAEIYCPKSSPMVADGGPSIARVLEIGSDSTSIQWAVNNQDALAPTPLWGGNAQGAQFVRVRNDGPLVSIPVKWLKKKAPELRSKEEDTFSVSITKELDGSKQDFGSRAWELLVNRAPILKRKLSDKHPLSSVKYSDRYLRSPLALLLLKEFVDALSLYPGGINATTSLMLITSNLLRNDLQQPRFIHHNWQDADLRRQAFITMFRSSGKFAINDAKANFDLPHARELQLRWNDGSGYSIRLDQGVGYWRTAKGMKSFPFDQPSKHQLKFLEEFEFEVEASNPNFPTQWYLSELEGVV
ncbi:MAG: DEAD/DEAH box helicase [Thermodesulfobacteriota bacterium]|nr:DEAD/DEAH box helicase [Thermodesulfobacteriota bacterium]